MQIDQQRELQQLKISREGWRVRPVLVSESIVRLLPVTGERIRDAYGLTLRDHQFPGFCLVHPPQQSAQGGVSFPGGPYLACVYVAAVTAALLAAAIKVQGRREP